MDRFEGILRQKRDIQILIKSKRFSEGVNDWVPLESLKKYVAALIKDFLEEIRKIGTR